MLLPKNYTLFRMNGNLFQWIVCGILSVGLMASTGCSFDMTTFLDTLFDSSTSTDGDFTSSDLVGTWSGSITADSEAMDYNFTVDSSGNFTASDEAGTTGTAAITSGGAVSFVYTYGSYEITLKGTMSSDKSSIVMATAVWTLDGSSTSKSFSGTLYLDDSDDDDTTYLLSDLVGTWTGTMTENGTQSTYKYVVESDGTLTINDSIAGTATITTGGTVVFTYSTPDYTGTYEGKMKSTKEAITMTTHTWVSDDDSGTANFTGTLTN
jgi:hypothetical protein